MAYQLVENEEHFRPSPSFPPCVWGDTFTSYSFQQSEFESYNKEVEVLKEDVKNMLVESTRELKENIEFINTLCRLGLSYHFESEIDEQLNHIFTDLPNLLKDNDYDLYTLSLLFRVLRQYGYKMSCDVFEKFKDNNGEFKKSIASDVKGILSLYEASFLSVRGEDILDEALAFTKQQLEISVENQIPHLAEHIKNALHRPFHHGLERAEALRYIPFYERDESRNKTLLKFAKLDFNRLQLLYRKELSFHSRWWKDLNPAKNFYFSRDRLVETYLWIFGLQSQPCYEFARLMGNKYTMMVGVLDDMYDTYGTVQDLECFTSAFERCTIDAIDGLPRYMKVIYRIFLDLFDETEKHEDEGVRYRTSIAKKTFQETARAYLVDSKWINGGHLPSFDEFVRNGLTTSTVALLSSGTFIGIGDVLGKKEYEWIESNPEIIRAAKLIVRLVNDTHTHEVENEKTKNCTLAITSYMKDYGVSQKEAIERIKQMIANAWKDMNEDCMKPTAVSRMLLQHYVNHARAVDFFENNVHGVDAFIYPSLIKDEIKALFLEPLPLI